VTHGIGAQTVLNGQRQIMMQAIQSQHLANLTMSAKQKKKQTSARQNSHTSYPTSFPISQKILLSIKLVLIPMKLSICSEAFHPLVPKISIHLFRR